MSSARRFTAVECSTTRGHGWASAGNYIDGTHEAGDPTSPAKRAKVSSIADRNMDREGVTECTPEVARREPCSLASQRKPCKCAKADARTRTGAPFITSLEPVSRQVAPGRAKWVFSFLTADRRRTFCLYEAPSPDALRAAARRAHIPADVIVEVSQPPLWDRTSALGGLQHLAAKS